MLKSSTKQKKVIKKMKDETKDILKTVEFIALKNKMHSFIKIDDKGGKKPKGVNENVT